MRDIRIAAAQFEARDADKEYNFGRIEALGSGGDAASQLLGRLVVVDDLRS